MRINHPLILKGLFGSLKILYFIVFKRNTAVISPINHHHFYGRAANQGYFLEKQKYVRDFSSPIIRLFSAKMTPLSGKKNFIEADLDHLLNLARKVETK